MHDLPSQTLKQQAHARPVSGEELEVFGKYAASQFTAGLHGTLTKAVVETVKQAEEADLPAPEDVAMV